MFGATLCQVFMIVMQNIQVVKNNHMYASICAMLIACFNVLIVKSITVAETDAIIGYVIANGCGVVLAMKIGNRKRASKEVDCDIIK